jgi:recombination endonuclease VII
MSSNWTGKPCGNKECGRKKSPTCADKKYCATCARRFKKERAQALYNKRAEEKFGITEEEYQALYRHQGGRCALCQHSQGKTKRLCVDHDHKCVEGHPPEFGCKKCVRGLLCQNCNRNVLGRAARDDPAFFIRGYSYLTASPASFVFG